MDKTVKVKVVKDFRDRKGNLALRKTGEEFEAADTRAKDLQAKGFVEIVKETKPKASDPDPELKKKKTE